MVVINIILVVLCVAMYVIVKVKKDKLRTWLGKTHIPNDVKSAMEDVLYFWRMLFQERVRLATLVVFLAFQKDKCGICAIILLGISYYLAVKKSLQKIEWDVKEVQVMITLAMVCPVIVCAFNLLSKYNEYLSIGINFVNFIIIVGILGFEISLMKSYELDKKRKEASNQGKTPNTTMLEAGSGVGDGDDLNNESFVGDDGDDSNNESSAGDSKDNPN